MNHTAQSPVAMSQKPSLGFWQIFNMSFGFFGIQIGFALQNANMSRIFQTLGASMETLPILWIAGPVTGLLIQPLVGYFSDRTWTGLGRRRPYFLAGAIVASLALFVMPSVPILWIAAAMLWILDAAINISMEPFRAFVGDMLPPRQRTQGFAMQGIFIGVGAVLASFAPYVLSNYFDVASTAPEGVVPDNVKWSFYIGAAAFFLAVFYTVVTTREYPPEQLRAFEQDEISRLGIEKDLSPTIPEAGFFARYGGAFLSIGLALTALVAAFRGDKQLYVFSGLITLLGVFFTLNARAVRAGRKAGFMQHIIGDLVTMPVVMRRLALVQFFSWFALFIMWIYTTPAVTSFHFGTVDTTSQAYADGGDWVGILFGVYNGIAAVYAVLIPFIAARLGLRGTHAISLIAGGLGLASFGLIKDPQLLLLGMVGVGMAWAAILTLPYAILSNVLPAEKMGTYMGIFNFFIVIPQIVVAGVMGSVMKWLFPDTPIAALIIGGLVMIAGALTLRAVPFSEPVTDA